MSIQALKDAITNGVATDIVNAANKLSVTDFGNVSDEMAAAILTAKGVAIKFEKPVDVKSDYYMKAISSGEGAAPTPETTDADGDGVMADVDADDNNAEVQ